MTVLFSERLRPALKAAGLHLLLSAGLASGLAILVFRLWFPAPFDELIHGRQLFLLITVVDVVCGPLLTLVLFDPSKPRYKWRIDLTLIVLVQCAALAYGLAQLSGSRPVLLAFEGDRFRIVQAADVEKDALPHAPEELRTLGWTGPRMVGVKLLESTDPEYPKSVQLAMQGLHPAFRPSRWIPYEQSIPRLRSTLRPLIELSERYPARTQELTVVEHVAGLRSGELGFLPLVSGETTDWVVVLRRDDLRAVGFLHMDAW